MTATSALKIFCAGAVKSPVVELAREFERETQQTLEFTFGTVGGLRGKAAAEGPDVLVLTDTALSELADESSVRRETIVRLGEVGVGIAVSTTASIPDVSTPERLRDALLTARSLAYGDPGKGDSSGIHFAKVLERLGIGHEVQPRVRLAAVGLAVADMVAAGEVELGATQASVILSCQGVKLAGLLPESLQHVTTYAAGVMRAAKSRAAAEQLLAYLATPQARSAFARAGLK